VWIGISVLNTVVPWILAFWGAGGARTHSAHLDLQEVLVEDNGSANKIAVIDVDGLITGGLIDGGSYSMVTMIQDQLKAAESDGSVKAVLLKVDSPGGEILAADEIYRALLEFQKRSGKPVVASLAGVAASGGYYISAPCRWILAHELTITGSIGVILHTYNYRGLLDKVGIRPVVYKSGKFKDMLSGDKNPGEVDPEEQTMVQALVKQSFDRFKAVIAEGRRRAAEQNQGEGRPLDADWENMADGRILSGQDAFQKGFVDELGDFKQAVKRAVKVARLKDANLVRYQAPIDIMNVLRWFVKADAPAVKLELGMALPKLRPGYLYYLAPSFIR
jgi:protease-4